MKPGDRIGPYRLIALLGRGGMGEVFAAVHERIGQAVAIKLLTSCSPAAAARFIQEARALAQLEHPGVVRVLFLGETADGVPYMVLEQVLGRSLRELLRDYPAGLPQARALSLLAQVAAAMAAVHRRGILHRDLKPDNILVVPGNGAADTVKVIDFGIARVPPPVQPGADTLIETGEQGPHWLGTVAYMAPEQCRRDSALGPPADVYALGVVLYETLCGQPPFHARDPVEVLAMHLQTAPELGKLGAGAPRRLIQAMLNKDPARRPAMAAVAATLSELAAVDGGRRALSIAGGLIAAAGAAVYLGVGQWAAVFRQFVPRAKKNAPPAIAGQQKGVSLVQMRPPGLILIAHLEFSPQPELSEEGMRAALPEYQGLPAKSVYVPPTGVLNSGDFPAAGAQLTTWFAEVLAPLLSQHPDYLVIYFGLAPIPLMIELGWLIGPFRPVEVRLYHHTRKRFVPWTQTTLAAQLLPPAWSCERDDSVGDVVVRISTSPRVNVVAARAAVPDSLCEVALQLPAPSADVFCSESEVEAVAAAFKGVLDEITERFPRARRVHLFAAVQAGVAFQLGTQVSRNSHRPVMTYQYKSGAAQPALLINDPAERPSAPPGGTMATDFQPLFTKFHEKIKLKDTEENAGLRERRDAILDHLREQMRARHQLRFQMFNSGSYAMGTGIQPLRGAEYDIDVGAIFSLEHAKQDPRQLKDWVFQCLPSSLGRVEWRRPCITVFRKDHHMDLGVFVQDGGGLWLAMGKQTDLPVKWQQDGIQLFIEDVRKKFPDSPDNHRQFQRVIRYLKRWKDFNFQGSGVKAPVGLALTVMAYKWFNPRSRGGNYNDLAALIDLVQRILDHFGGAQVRLEFPRAPGDDLLRKLSADQVRQMKDRFLKLAERLNEASTKGSTEPLVRAFGPDFPEV